MRSSFSTRIVLAFVLFVALVAFAGAVVVVRLSSLRTSLELLDKGYLALGRVSSQLHTMQEGTDATVAQAMANDDPLARDGLVRAARRWSPAGFERHLAEMSILVSSLGATGSRLKDAEFAKAVQAQIDAARASTRAYDDTTTALLAALTADAEVLSSSAATWGDASESLGRSLRSLSSLVDGRTATLIRRAQDEERRATTTMMAVGVVLLLATLFTGGWLLQALRPLSRLIEAVRAARRGVTQSDGFASLAGEGELGLLARELDALSSTIRDREQVLAERSDDMKRLQDFAENVVRSVQVGILVIDPQGDVRSINPAARSALGLTLREVEQRPINHVLTGSLAAAAVAAKRSAQQGVVEVVAAVHVGTRVVDLMMVPVRDRAGVRSGEAIVFAEDVTEREEARRRLLQSERLAAVGRVSAQIAHEIRNPLASIGLNVEMLEDDVDTMPLERQAEARVIIRAVLQEVRRLTEITEGHLRVARLPAIDAAPTEVGDVLAALAAFVGVDAARAGVQLELRVEPDLPAAAFDAAKLRQALLNLINNAVEAAGQGGTVLLRAQRGDDDHLMIAVEDTGPGIAAADQHRLFEPFFTTKATGTGLGLSVARGLAQEQGGELSYRPSSLGGAAFEVRIPAREPP